MATPQREEEAGALHHVYGHSIADSPLFVERFDYLEYLRLLEGVVRKRGWVVMTYCLMGNHVHLLVKTPEPNLAVGMRELHGRYAREFNERHGKRGARFREGYGSRRIKTDASFFAVVRYIPMNPVTAGMCGRPDDYEWSSYGALVRGEPPPWMGHGEMLWLLGTLARYQAIVNS